MKYDAKIYRIESPVGRSLWYTPTGEFNPFINNLTNALAKDFPMGFDAKFKEGGLDWLSAGKSIENMKTWFSKQDIEELLGYEYKLYEFIVREYKIEENQALFTRRGVVRQIEVPVEKVWG